MEASNNNVMLLDLTDMYFHNTKILHFTETHLSISSSPKFSFIHQSLRLPLLRQVLFVKSPPVLFVAGDSGTEADKLLYLEFLSNTLINKSK